MTISLDGVSQNSNDVLLLNDQTVHDLKISLPGIKPKVEIAEPVLSLKRKA